MANLNWDRSRKSGKKYLSDAIWKAKLRAANKLLKLAGQVEVAAPKRTGRLRVEGEESNGKKPKWWVPNDSHNVLCIERGCGRRRAPNRLRCEEHQREVERVSRSHDSELRT
jgi:hypothetical protein